MSKSKGDFLTISLLESKGYSPLVYRFMCLNSSYRKVLVFSYDALDQAKKSYDKLLSKIKNIKDEGILDEVKFSMYNNEFIKALENDLNTSNAITVIYDVIKDELINGKTKIELIKNFDKVLSLNLISKENIDESKLIYINDMIEKRKQAKENKDYALADKIRNDLENDGIIIKDTREGTIFELK